MHENRVPTIIHVFCVVMHLSTTNNTTNAMKKTGEMPTHAMYGQVIHVTVALGLDAPSQTTHDVMHTHRLNATVTASTTP